MYLLTGGKGVVGVGSDADDPTSNVAHLYGAR